MSYYDHTKIREYIASLGEMEIDERALGHFDNLAHGLGLKQDQFDRIVAYHADVVKTYFTPSNYRYIDRVKIALFWLFKRS